MRNLFASLLVLLALQGCAALPGTFVSDGALSASPQQAANIQSIFVASSRKLLEDGTYGIGRSPNLSFATYEVSIPQNRQVGSVPPSFLGSSAEFSATRASSMASLSAFSSTVLNYARNLRGTSEVMVFVHGFNSTFEHSLSRVAQMDLDFEFPAATILYAWPAASNITSYIHDIDSTTFARDGLVELLSGLASSGVSRIVVVGHSMGARLAMEAVRDLRLKNETRFFAKLGGIALLSPDIDMDVFTAQLRALAGMAAPVVAYVSPDDVTLENFSNFFIEGKNRLGTIKSAGLLDGGKALLIDVTDVGDPAQKSHLTVATSPVMIAAINEMDKPDLITYARELARGLVPGSEITRYGQTIRVRLAPY
jgi:esterase/lipase superfamily enzyme